MKIIIEDEFDGIVHEFDISDELYERVYVNEDKEFRRVEVV